MGKWELYGGGQGKTPANGLEQEIYTKTLGYTTTLHRYKRVTTGRWAMFPELALWRGDFGWFAKEVEEVGLQARTPQTEPDEASFPKLMVYLCWTCGPQEAATRLPASQIHTDGLSANLP